MLIKKLLHNPLVILLAITLLYVSCEQDPEEQANPQTEVEEKDTVNLSPAQILNKLQADYELIPEEDLVVNKDSTVFAQYTDPTDRYAHGILGDRIEAARLVVVVDGQFYEHLLDEQYVFEDIRPRIYDIDQDGVLEFITIRAQVNNGGGIAIYKVINNQLTEYAYVEEIGRRNRWLNIAAIDDLDKDGTIDLAWVQTPHIGGILKVAPFQEGELTPITEISQYSNHAIGDRNLCLSTLTEQEGKRVLYVPLQNRSKIVGFYLENGQWNKFEEIDQEVDFSKPLHEQYNFEGYVEDEENCIGL
ncbi:MAG: VCBS repeat-containing protein [Bacteroidota bacterium]